MTVPEVRVIVGQRRILFSIVLVTSLVGCLYDFHVKSTFYDTGGESFKFIVHIERPRFYCGEVCQGSGPG